MGLGEVTTGGGGGGGELGVGFSEEDSRLLVMLAIDPRRLVLSLRDVVSVSLLEAGEAGRGTVKTEARRIILPMRADHRGLGLGLLLIADCC